MRFTAEFRSEVTGDTLAGHAAVFGTHAEVRGGYEALAPSAFDDVLARDEDVRALINHNASLVLGRTAAGTLRLRSDDTGLAFEVDLPDTSYARDLRESLRRGDVTGMSFGFVPGKDEIDHAPDGRQLRTHTSLSKLLDVSVVTYPAYDGTDVTLRSVDFSCPRPTRLDSQRLIARHRARLARPGGAPYVY